MHIRAGYELSLRCERATPLSGLLSVHPSRARDVVSSSAIVSDGDAPLYTYHDSFGNTCTRTVVPAGTLTLKTDFVIADTGLPDQSADGADVVPVEELPDDALQYLLASRYCESDKLSPLAWSLFGDTRAGAPRVAAVLDYVHDRIRFGYEYASSTRSAVEAQEGRRGVCRDFVHLALAYCRALNMPARYCSGYLGDIDVPPSDVPMDFTAWMEVYLGHRWYTFDPRHNARRVGRILMAHGRDAADVVIYTTFGPSELRSFRVFVEQA